MTAANIRGIDAGIVRDWADLVARGRIKPDTILIQLEDLTKVMARGLRPLPRDPSTPGAVKVPGFGYIDERAVKALEDHFGVKPEIIPPHKLDGSLPDPCPGCPKGAVCRTPSCGRLKAALLGRDRQ